MRIDPLGDAAFILRDLSGPAYLWAEHLNASGTPGLMEAWASYETVGIAVDPETFQFENLTLPEALVDSSGRIVHQIPACFELGEDLEEVSKELNLTQIQVVELFSSVEYCCYAVGFCPGFPYLGYLPKALCGLERLPSPRLRVPAGSIAVTADQAGIYPSEHPGGWRILARSPLNFVDCATDYFPISAGHRVRFAPIDRDEFEARRGERL